MNEITNWYERYGFKANPYTIVDPFRVDDYFLEWNRDDLDNTHRIYQTFVEQAVSGYRVGLATYGAIGSGKTWLLKIIEKEFRSKLGDSPFLYIRTYVPRSEPTFSAIYGLFIDTILEKKEFILNGLTLSIGKRLGRTTEEIKELKQLIGESGWKNVMREIIPDRNLANCFWHLAYHEASKDNCVDWLKGEKLPTKTLDALELSVNLDRDFRRVGMLKNLIDLSLYAFSLVIFAVDEMENARPSTAGIIGDSIRDLLDSFSGRFSVICSYTAQRADELMDRGYGTWLQSRLEYYAELQALSLDSISQWLCKHNSLYRREEWQGGNQLLPFTEASIQHLLRIMKVEARYPRSIFVNCHHLCQVANEVNQDKIEPDFIDVNRDKLVDLPTQSTLI